jgi:hypothetical protein
VSPNAAIWWTVLAAAVVVFVCIVVQVVRTLLALRHIADRVSAYAELPVVAAMNRAETNAARIDAAVAQIDPLLVRARTAVEVIKRGPLPREVVVAYGRVRAEIAAFRAVAPRLRR